MKIAFLLQDTGRIYGAERATLDLISGLIQRGLSVAIWLIRELRMGALESDLQREIERMKLALTEIPVRGAMSFKLIRDLRARLVAERPDVVHPIGPKAVVHAALALAGRAPLVTTLHGWLYRPDPKERFYEWIERRALRWYSRVVTLSRHYEDLLAQALGVERVVRIPTGFSPPVFPGGAPRPDEMAFGMLGRLSWEKNHELFLEAIRRWPQDGPRAKFVIAGEGPRRSRLERLARELGLDRTVEFRGWVSADDFFRQTAVLVQCSRMENLPYSVLQAMAWERPVVATRVGGLPDLVEDGRTGFLVPPDDPDVLLQRMVELAADAGLRERLGRAGRAKLEQEFRPETALEAYVALYRSVGAR